MDIESSRWFSVKLSLVDSTDLDRPAKWLHETATEFDIKFRKA